MRSPYRPMSRCATVLVTARSRFGLALCLAAALAAIAPARAQPAPRRPGPAAPPPASPPELDPETRARLDDQAAALADATRKLAEQQQAIDRLSAALADDHRARTELRDA